MKLEHNSFFWIDKLNTLPRPAAPVISRLIALARKNDLGMSMGLLILCLITRLMAQPASLWEWDDLLFANALHTYDLTAHSPHPPGFPVFVAMTRLAFWLLNDEYLALTVVAVIFTSLLGPALFYFYREVFQDRRVAFAGALLGSFAPNVWVQSGAGRSDELAMSLGIIGLTLVIHGVRSGSSLIAGCALFGLAMGVRTTMLPVMGATIALVFLVRLHRRQWRLVLAGLAAGTFCVLVWYVPLILKVTWHVYREATNLHSKYIFETDTIFSMPQSGRISYRFSRFLVEIWGAKWITWAIYPCSLLGLITLACHRRWKAIGWMLLAFVPFMIFTLVINTPLGAPLYSLPYVPFFTGLAACGLLGVPEPATGSGNGRRFRNLGFLLVTLLVIGMVATIYPIIRGIHNEVSPPIRAMNYLKNNFDPERDALYFDVEFSPHVRFYLPDGKKIVLNNHKIPEANLISPQIAGGRIFALTVAPVPGEPSMEFHWSLGQPHKRRLERLSLGRYFDVYVSELNTARVGIQVFGIERRLDQ